MKTMKPLLLVLVMLALALTASPAAAERRSEQGFRGGQREERQMQEHRDYHGRGEHARPERHDHDFAYRVPYSAPYCYTQNGYWTWDGWQQVWVPAQTICQ